MANEGLTPKITDVRPISNLETMKKQKTHDHQREDHTPVTETATWTIDKFKNELNNDKFKNELNSTALPAWDMNYDEHVYYHMLTIMEAAQRSFARQAHRPYQEYVTQDKIAF
eukprot:4353722-Pyramimonas_sp.AAC.1